MWPIRYCVQSKPPLSGVGVIDDHPSLTIVFDFGEPHFLIGYHACMTHSVFEYSCISNQYLINHSDWPENRKVNKSTWTKYYRRREKKQENVSANSDKMLKIKPFLLWKLRENGHGWWQMTILMYIANCDSIRPKMTKRATKMWFWVEGRMENALIDLLDGCYKLISDELKIKT